MTVKTDLQNITRVSPGAADRPEACRWAVPGARSKGIGALTEFTVEAAPADDPKKVTKLKFAKADGRFRPARDAARTDL